VDSDEWLVVSDVGITFVDNRCSFIVENYQLSTK
jgi:hypothetical protein